VHEGNARPAATDPWLLVYQANSLRLQMLEGGVDVDDREGDVVHPLPASGQEFPNRRFITQGLQQLDVGTADGDHGLFDSLAFYDLAMNRLDPVLAPVFLQGRVEVTNRDSDVIDIDEEHGIRLGAPLVACAMMRTRPPIAEIRRIYQRSHTIAVVGASPDPTKHANVVPAYLQDQGYRIIPVNPSHDEILGERSYPTLLDIPEPVDVVEVFRPAEDAPEIAEKAVQIGATVLWLQLGILSEEAARIAGEGGLAFVEDHCMGQMHAMLDLGPGPAQVD